MSGVYFLTFDERGKQKFWTKEGPMSGLLEGVPVVTNPDNVRSKFTSENVVAVDQLPVGSIISKKCVERWIVQDGDDALKASLGWLEDSEAPDVPELGLVLVYGDGKLRQHRFVIGGKALELNVDVAKLFDLCSFGSQVGKGKVTVTVRVEFSSLVFLPGKKITRWQPIEEMFKSSLAMENCQGCKDGQFLYTRFRLLEVAGKRKSSVFLQLEALPLECGIREVDAELRKGYESSSNVAICLGSVELKFYKEEPTKALYTSPFLVLEDDLYPTDGVLRLHLELIRDSLRAGQRADTEEEATDSVRSPTIMAPWARGKRKLHMPVSKSTSVVISSGENYYFFHLN